jgi:urea carboxylase
MFHKVLVANRGEIACRILRTLRRMSIRSVAVYSEVDEFTRHAREADEAACIGGPRPADSYLNADRILEVARRTGAEAIHPGYGFLSERAEFAQACEEAGIRFIGPTPEQIRAFGLKHLAREMAAKQGVPLLPGTPLLASADEAIAQATRIGYPVILKSTAGGGGIGLRICRDASELAIAFVSVERLGSANFGDSGSYLERFVEPARHIEVQIFGDGRGRVVVLGERDCSVQRRNQKVVEETPAPGLTARAREQLFDAAARMGRAFNYRSAGTVEFVLDASTEEFFFLEVNTRLQVEHGVTEAVTGVDLVEWMILEAASSLDLKPVVARGAAIEVRVYAEDPAMNHQPSTGTITDAVFDPAVRVDGWVEPGTEITPYYDPLLAKVIAYGETRTEALEHLERALAGSRIAGVENNLAYLRQVIAAPAFRSGNATTRLLSEIEYRSASIDVVNGGTQTTIQDWPGRTGLWAVGVPPSGPMDNLAFGVANRAVGNDPGAAALEMTLSGPTLRFRSPTVIALAGARMRATLDDVPADFCTPLAVRAGSELRLGTIEGGGCRTYLAVRGGFDVPSYLGSKSTFMLGRFGGHGGRALRAGDVLPVARAGGAEKPPAVTDTTPFSAYPPVWEIEVLDGPHGAPDFFTPDDIDDLYAATWEVHYHSDRTGVRLIGPKPRWARRDGGEAGLHPSNIHDNAYAVGTVDYTGDMPVILGPDGPSLGGFVCPVTIVSTDRWKIGQLKAGDKVRFVPGARGRVSPILGELAESDVGERVVYRRDGDDCLLVEYGPPVLALGLRLRAHALMEALERQSLEGIIDLTPGIRSLQIHHDPTVLPARRLQVLLRDLERDLPRLDEIEIPTRIVYLPLSWEDPATLLAIEKYTRSVRADAPWCPSNIEFIRRINGLSSVDDVRRIVFDASYLVLGLGDVYLGAPVATPLDPRHRLVTTKYNPARTWTPENAVGIGGAYLCIYGMEGPGGYQLVGRTLQVWNPYHTRQADDFRDGKPYLLRFFDEIRFEPVAADELLALRRAFPYGKAHIKIEESTFRYSSYRASLANHAQSIGVFKQQQQAAFDAERERWRAAGDPATPATVRDPHLGDNALVGARLPPSDIADSPPPVPDGCAAITSPVAGSVWQVASQVGVTVRAGDPIVIVEAMKMEIAVVANAGGKVERLFVSTGTTVAAGQVVAFIRSVSV